jgi:Poly(ADP-ribose) polymerase catalytic domain
MDNRKILDNLKAEAIRLEEGIQTGDIVKIQDSISMIIKRKAIVSISFSGMLNACSAHSYYFPYDVNRLPVSDFIIPSYCSFNHFVCLKCASNYITSMFHKAGIMNLYECPGCFIYNVKGSLLISDEYLIENLYYFIGQNLVDILLYPITPQISIFKDACQCCQESKPKLGKICNTNHSICNDCLCKWIDTISSPNQKIKCPYTECNSPINSTILKDFLGSTNKLYKIKHNLEITGIKLDYCPNCFIVIKLNPSNEVSYCTCKTQICSFCGKSDHFGYTCFYSISKEKYEEILLTPPVNDHEPSTILELEYVKAKYAFNNFINPSSNLVFNQAKFIVNKKLEERYAKKKIEMAKQCGGRDKVNEVYSWHGSAEANYPHILRQGLKVGGVDGVKIAVGKACGYGIYSATTPNTPIRYAKGTKWLVCFLGMKGKNSTTPINDSAQLNNPNTHSYSCNGDWVIFFTKEQVLPRFLIEYRMNKN